MFYVMLNVAYFLATSKILLNTSFLTTAQVLQLKKPKPMAYKKDLMISFIIKPFI